MRGYDSEEQIGLFFRCMMNQISLMEACYIEGIMDKVKCEEGIAKFYTLMLRINNGLESNGYKPLKCIFMGREGNA
jgi:hypothetical protein